MAENQQDDAQKTEEPTQKKLAEARKHGQVAQSQEVKSWAILLGGVIGMWLLAPGIATKVGQSGRPFIEMPDQISISQSVIVSITGDILANMGLVLMPLALLLVFLSLGAGLGQSGLMIAPEKIKPKPSKISPLKGLKQRFSMSAVMEFVKGILKLAVVTFVSFGLALPMLGDFELISGFSMLGIMDRLQDVIVMLLVGALIVMTVIAAIDFTYQKSSFTKQMRMSKQEVKDEHKQSEGDPQIKARIRRIRSERYQKRMMAAVPDADVVITNPTHYAVALVYKMDNMQAPKLVAKGVDLIALRIRDLADDNDIPIVENPPLARALYATVELDGEIPLEHYKAVAEVIGYVMRLRGELPPEEGAPEPRIGL